MSEVVGPIEKSGLIISDLEVLRMHYSHTLRNWKERCINNKSNKEKEALESFGRNLGICFQITDDILEVISDEETLGKNINSDTKNQKSTS